MIILRLIKVRKFVYFLNLLSNSILAHLLFINSFNLIDHNFCFRLCTRESLKSSLICSFLRTRQLIMPSFHILNSFWSSKDRLNLSWFKLLVLEKRLTSIWWNLILISWFCSLSLNQQRSISSSFLCWLIIIFEQLV